MSLKSWLKDEYDITLVFMDGLENSGYFIHQDNVMFVNPCLSENEMITVVLHELGHHLKDDDVIGKYEDYIPRSKMEYKANYYMIEHLLDTWCDVNNVELSDINYVAFLEANELSLNFMPIIEKVLYMKNRQTH